MMAANANRMLAKNSAEADQWVVAIIGHDWHEATVVNRKPPCRHQHEMCQRASYLLDTYSKLYVFALFDLQKRPVVEQLEASLIFSSFNDSTEWFHGIALK